MRLIDAHVALLKAELAIAGRALAIIVGLALGALLLAGLLLTLLFVGTFLFLGEWLFGSMGWGLIHGTLLTVAIVAGIALELAGAWMGAYVRGFVVGVVTTIVLSLLFASNLLRQGAVSAGVELEPTVPLHPNLLPTLVGLVVGALVLAVVALAAAWRSEWRAQAVAAGLLVGGFVGAILGSALFDNPGAVAIALMVGLVTWIAVAGWLAARRGFDPEARYADLVPRQTMAAFEQTRDFLDQQLQRQKRRMMGR